MLNFRRLHGSSCRRTTKYLFAIHAFLAASILKENSNAENERVGRLLPFFDHIFLEFSRQISAPSSSLLSEFRGYLLYYLLA